MTGLSLRTRVLAGLAAIALVLAAVASVVTATTRDHLIDQLDDQLLAAIDPNRDGRLGALGGRDRPPPPADDPLLGDPPERLSPMFEGLLLPDGTLEVFFEPNLPGQGHAPPAIDATTVANAAGSPFTTEATDGAVRYRVVAVETAVGSFIRALPLADADETVDRLVLLQLTGLGAVLAALAAVAWWVIRLGIRPINAMTRAATAISDDDLSARIPEPAATGTEAAALATALNHMLDRIDAAVDDRRLTEERLRRFVADASHELRTPVTTIQGYAELYRHGGLDDPDELDDAMRRTEDEALRMGRLVEDMLTLAKLDRQRPVAADEVDLSMVVSDAVADARLTAPEHHVTATIEPGLAVAGDRDRLTQIVVNILANATSHTPAGSTIEVDARSDGTEVVVDVTDDGPGIEPDHLERVTERFYQADPSRARSGGGSGLGLSIVESAVDAHGGSLRLTSDAGAGTTVTVRLPRKTRGSAPVVGPGSVDGKADVGS